MIRPEAPMIHETKEKHASKGEERRAERAKQKKIFELRTHVKAGGLDSHACKG